MSSPHHAELPIFPAVRIPKFPGPHLCAVGVRHLKDFPSLHQIDSISSSEGFDISRALDVEAKAALLQSWLYFGLTEKIVGHCIKEELESVEEINHRLATTIQILWSKRSQALQKLSGPEFDTAQKEIVDDMHFANQILRIFDRVEADPECSLARVALSVRFLLEALHYFQVNNTFRHHFPWRAMKVSLTPLSRYATSLSTSVIFNQMRSGGWCPQQIHAVFASRTFLQAYYFSSLVRRFPPGMQHDNCSTTQCIASKIDSLAFKPRHHREKCQCLSIQPPLDEVMRIVDSGGIPLIRATKLPRGELRLDVVEAKWFTSYVAISHVWSDQSFGASSNRLPQCQVEHMQDRLVCLRHWRRRIFTLKKSDDSQIHSSLFWLDTFCVPQGPQNERLRKKAINMMDCIYASARLVLVFDHELQQLSWNLHSESSNALSTHRTMLTAHVVVSRWMQRAWTYQECVMAKSVHLQLKDSTISTRDLHPWFRKRSRQVFRNAVTNLWTDVIYLWIWLYEQLSGLHYLTPGHLLLMLPPLTALLGIEHLLLGMSTRCISVALHVEVCQLIPCGIHFHDSTPFPWHLVNVWNDLSGRIATKAEDLITILADLTGYAQGAFGKQQGEEGAMKILLFSWKHLPLDILFVRGSRCGTGFDRWIPAVPSGWLNPKYPWGSMRFTDEGFILDVHPPSEVYLVHSRANEAHMFRVQSSGGRARFVHCLPPSEDYTLDLPPHASYVVIFGDLEEGDRDHHGLRLGARLLVSGEDGRRMLLRYDCPVRAFEPIEVDTDGSPYFPAFPRITCYCGNAQKDSLEHWPLLAHEEVSWDRRLILQHGEGTICLLVFLHMQANIPNPGCAQRPTYPGRPSKFTISVSQQTTLLLVDACCIALVPFVSTLCLAAIVGEDWKKDIGRIFGAMFLGLYLSQIPFLIYSSLVAWLWRESFRRTFLTVQTRRLLPGWLHGSGR